MLRRVASSVLALILSLTIAAPCNGSAPSVPVRAVVNGVELPAAAAQIISDRTMVSVRALAEAIGASVAWDGAAKTLTVAAPVLREIEGDWETLRMPVGQGGAYPVSAAVMVNAAGVGDTAGTLFDTFGCGYIANLGDQVTFQVRIVNTTGMPGSELPASTVQLDSYAPAVAICSVDPESGAERPVWQGYLTGAPSCLGPGQGALCTFTWDQRGAAGYQVPVGPCLVKLLPFSLSVHAGSETCQYSTSSSGSNTLCRVLIVDPACSAPSSFSAPAGSTVQVALNGALLHSSIAQADSADVLISLRDVADAVGGIVVWEPSTRTAYLAFPVRHELPASSWKTDSAVPGTIEGTPVEIDCALGAASNTAWLPDSGQPYAPLEQPIHFEWSVCNTTGLAGVPAAEVNLQAYAPLVTICAIDQSGQEHAVWQAYLTGCPTILRVGERAVYAFTWDQKDAAGRQVPPGDYRIKSSPFYICADGWTTVYQGEIASVRSTGGDFSIINPASLEERTTAGD